jgi:hypothetical protein
MRGLVGQDGILRGTGSPALRVFPLPHRRKIPLRYNRGAATC